MSIPIEWLMHAPAKDIAAKALGSLDTHAKNDAERLELMTSIIIAVRESASAALLERLVDFLEPSAMREKQH